MLTNPLGRLQVTYAHGIAQLGNIAAKAVWRNVRKQKGRLENCFWDADIRRELSSGGEEELIMGNMGLDSGSVPPVGPKGPSGPTPPHGPPEAEKTRPVEEAPAEEAVVSAAEVEAAARAVQAAPDVRLDRVAELRARIERGQFEIDANRIAEAILEGQ